MAEYNIDQFTYGGNTYKFVDNTVNTGKVKTVSLSSTAPLSITAGTGDSATTINKTIALSNANVNTVLAGPSSGSTASAPSYRKLVNADIPAALTGKTYNGYTLAAASAKGVDTGITSSTLTSTNLPTTKAVVDYIGTNPGGYTNNTGTVTSVATGVGLTGGTITGTGTIKAKLKSETAATYDSTTITNTSGRQYAVVQDKSGYLSVNVPWEAGSGSGSGTDEKVTQTNIDNNSNYRILLSYSANDNTDNNSVYKSAALTFNPSAKLLSTTGTMSYTQANEATTLSMLPVNYTSNSQTSHMGYGNINFHLGTAGSAPSVNNINNSSFLTPSALYLMSDYALPASTAPYVSLTKNSLSFTKTGNIPIGIKIDADAIYFPALNTNQISSKVRISRYGFASVSSKTNRTFTLTTGNQYVVFVFTNGINHPYHGLFLINCDGTHNSTVAEVEASSALSASPTLSGTTLTIPQAASSATTNQGISIWIMELGRGD